MSDSDRPSRGATILIIADDDVTATDVQTELTGAGYVVRRAGSADEALGTLEQTRADLILMSLMLPDADGLALCSMLKTRFRSPIIFLSGRRGEVDRALALESGAIDVLTTPINVDALLTQVRAAVQTPVSGRLRPY